MPSQVEGLKNGEPWEVRPIGGLDAELRVTRGIIDKHRDAFRGNPVAALDPLVEGGLRLGGDISNNLPNILRNLMEPYTHGWMRELYVPTLMQVATQSPHSQVRKAALSAMTPGRDFIKVKGVWGGYGVERLTDDFDHATNPARHSQVWKERLEFFTQRASPAIERDAGVRGTAMSQGYNYLYHYCEAKPAYARPLKLRMMTNKGQDINEGGFISPKPSYCEAKAEAEGFEPSGP